MNFSMKHAPGAGLITKHFDLVAISLMLLGGILATKLVNFVLRKELLNLSEMTTCSPVHYHYATTAPTYPQTTLRVKEVYCMLTHVPTPGMAFTADILWWWRG